MGQSRGGQTGAWGAGPGLGLAGSVLACAVMLTDTLARPTPGWAGVLTLLPATLMFGLAGTLLLLRPRRLDAQAVAVFLVALGVLARGNLAGLDRLFPVPPTPVELRAYEFRPGYLLWALLLGSAPLLYAVAAGRRERARQGAAVRSVPWVFLALAATAQLVASLAVIEGRVGVPSLARAVGEALSPYHRLLMGGFPILLAQHGAALVLLARRYDRTRDAGDRGLLLFFGASVAFVGAAIVNDLLAAVPTVILSHLLGAAVPIVLVYALERHGLFDLRLTVGRVVQYALARRVLALATVAPLLALALFLGLSLDVRYSFGYPLFELRRGVPFDLAVACGAASCGAAAMLAAHGPLLRWFDRTYFREKYDAQRVLEEMTRSLLGRTDAREIARAALEGVESVLHPEGAVLLSLEAGPGGDALALLARRGAGGDVTPDAALLSLPEARALPWGDADGVPADPWLESLPGPTRQALRESGACLAVPLLEGEGATGLLLLGPKRSGLDYTPEDVDVLRAVAPQIALALQSARLTREFARRRTAELTTRSVGFVELVEQERRLIAADLHDQTLPELRGLLADLEAMEKDPALGTGRSVSGEDAAVPEYPVPNTKHPTPSDMAAHLRQAISNVRDIMESLRPSALEMLGLMPALEGELRNVTARARPALVPRFRAEGDPPAWLTPFEEVSIFRIAQEALNNACRHSGAGGVSLAARVEGDDWVLRVEDDGAGMPPEERRQAGYGLGNMQYRAGLMGARLAWGAPESGRGTRVELRVPLEKPTGNERE